MCQVLWLHQGVRPCRPSSQELCESRGIYRRGHRESCLLLGTFCRAETRKACGGVKESTSLCLCCWAAGKRQQLVQHPHAGEQHGHLRPQRAPQPPLTSPEICGKGAAPGACLGTWQPRARADILSPASSHHVTLAESPSGFPTEKRRLTHKH